MIEYIDRENIIKKIKQVYCSDCNSYDGVRCRACGIEDAILQIEAGPAADVAPAVHGEWEKLQGMVPPEYHGKHMCSECGRVALSRQYHELLSNYCPYCGAKMDGGNKND